MKDISMQVKINDKIGLVRTNCNEEHLNNIFDTKTLYTGLHFNYNNEDIVIIMSLKEVGDTHFILYTFKEDKEQVVYAGGFPKDIIKDASNKHQEQILKSYKENCAPYLFNYAKDGCLKDYPGSKCNTEDCSICPYIRVREQIEFDIEHGLVEIEKTEEDNSSPETEFEVEIVYMPDPLLTKMLEKYNSN